MQIIDNINHIVKNDLQESIRTGSKLSIAAACFSIYAYQELKKQLESIDELRFIFTSPTFVTEKTPKAQREFYIPRISRERSLYGTEFEVKLRNELTQKAVAKECADWIRRKAIFKSNVTQEQMMGFMTVDESTYMPINGFTTVDLGCERGNNAYYPVQKTESYENANYFLKLFEQLWNDKNRLQEVTDVVIENISAAYRENAPEYIYFVALYNIFNEFLDDISEDELPNEATGFKESKIWGMLYNFQRDAVLAIISKLEKFNGCILADSVGLGKTFTALAVIKYYENRNKSVLVLCPKKLSENWNTYKGNYINNPIAADRLRYDVLYHTDLSREHGQSNGIDLDRLNWGNYDLVVIDESHNFRNGGEVSGEDAKENRYLKLLNKIVNEFERKLRKLLYLASSLHGDENSQKVIVGLEEQELGNIFETLFSDAAFVKKAKETINKTLSWQFTRAELLDAINKLDENRLWTLLLGDDCVETLCSSFSEIRNYRNDVMHAHNIDYEQFNKAHKLFKKVNTELDSAIGKLIGAKETNTEVTSTDFNNTLSSALAALHSPIDTSGLLVVSEALKSITSNQPIISPEVSKTLSQIGRFATGECTLKPEVIAAIANLGKIAALQSEIAPATRAMSEIAKQLASYKIDIPPAVTELQQRLSEIDFSMLPNSNNTQQEDEEKNPNEPHEI